MKIAVCGDIHMCKTSSIVRGKGKVFSKRLENCIESINWFEEEAKKYKADKIIYLGDFFDTPELDEETITAVKAIKWSKDIDHYFIVGNHESSTANLDFSSTMVLQRKNFHIVSRPMSENGLTFIPYLTEDKRQPLSKYVSNKNDIVFSHNDLKGVQYGKYESVSGFDIDDISKNCRLFINGHIHNQSWINQKIINLGNLTGQNFSEDATHYSHSAMFLYVEEDNYMSTIEDNRYAFNFYKLDIEKDTDIDQLQKLKNNAVLSVRCLDKLSDKVKELLAKKKEQGLVSDYRLIIFRSVKDASEEVVIEFNKVDHLSKFQQFMLSKQSEMECDMNLLKKELQEVCS